MTAQDTPTASTLDAAQALDPRALVALRDNQRQLDQDGVEVGVSRQALDETLAHLAALQQQLDEARAANERDRTEVIDAVNSLKAEFVGRNWLIGESRGSYEWDDDRFRQEFRDAMAAFAPHVERLRKIGADHSNCPTSHDAIKAARAELALSEARATLSLIANDLRVAQWVRSMAANGAHDVSARDAPQAQPVVKALPWYKPMGSLTLSRADTDLGIYRAWSHHEADGKWFWSLDGYEKLHGDPVEDEEAAKAAAQADFERRILSALTRPSPPTVDAPEAQAVYQVKLIDGNWRDLKKSEVPEANDWGELVRVLYTRPSPPTEAKRGDTQGDPICRRCATQEHGSPPLPEHCICGDYPAEDYSHLSGLLQKANEPDLRALLSNNLNIIIGALNVAAKKATGHE